MAPVGQRCPRDQYLQGGGKHTGSADGSEIRGTRSDDIVMFNRDPNNEIDDSGGVLAVGGTYTIGSSTIRGLGKACNGFIVGNDSPTANPYLSIFTCHENILTQEMGHVAGLGHSAAAGALMAPTLSLAPCIFPFWPHNADRTVFRDIYDHDCLSE